jgi:uncharacterized membrane protein YeaQ/YmgE (transglycosylase-associated protein family)
LNALGLIFITIKIRYSMDTNSLIMTLIIGAIAGWLAGSIMKGKSFGLVGNIVIGIIGAVVGGYIFNILNVSIGGIIGSIISATFGAVVLLYVVRLLKKA